MKRSSDQRVLRAVGVRTGRWEIAGAIFGLLAIVLGTLGIDRVDLPDSGASEVPTPPTAESPLI